MKRRRGHGGTAIIIIIIINIINIVINPLTPGPGSENDDLPPRRSLCSRSPSRRRASSKTTICVLVGTMEDA